MVWAWVWVLPPELEVVSPTAPPKPVPPEAVMVGVMVGVKVMVGLELDAPPWPLAVTSPLVEEPPKPPAPPVAEELPPVAALEEV